jgi:hypothetical protein
MGQMDRNFEEYESPITWNSTQITLKSDNPKHELTLSCPQIVFPNENYVDFHIDPLKFPDFLWSGPKTRPLPSIFHMPTKSTLRLGLLLIIIIIII